MDLKTVFKIQIMTLSDSICFGLIYAFINPYLLIVGGNHLTVGIFSVLNLLCELFSADITKWLTEHNGKCFSLFTVSVAATISHLLITLTRSPWFIIISRCIFSLTHQTNRFCREILLKNIPDDEREYFLSVHNVLSSAGFIIGPLVAGCLFAHGFSYVCFLAASLTLGNVWLSTYFIRFDDSDEKKEVDNEKSIIEKAKDDITEVVKNFNDSDIAMNWDLIALKFLFTTSVTIFFSKFTQILKYNYDFDAVAIGTTSSYQNGLAFACPFAVDFIKDKYETEKFSLLSPALLTLLASLLCACYAPITCIYLLFCIPMIVARCYLSYVWPHLFATRKNNALNKLNGPIGVCTGLTIPILFGIVCNHIEHHAVILFSVVPVMLSLLILFKSPTWMYNALNEENDDGKNKDE